MFLHPNVHVCVLHCKSLSDEWQDVRITWENFWVDARWTRRRREETTIIIWRRERQESSSSLNACRGFFSPDSHITASKTVLFWLLLSSSHYPSIPWEETKLQAKLQSVKWLMRRLKRLHTSTTHYPLLSFLYANGVLEESCGKEEKWGNETTLTTTSDAGSQIYIFRSKQ